MVVAVVVAVAVVAVLVVVVVVVDGMNGVCTSPRADSSEKKKRKQEGMKGVCTQPRADTDEKKRKHARKWRVAIILGGVVEVVEQVRTFTRDNTT